MLQHSCGSGQPGPADPAGEVSQPGRAVPGLCPRGGGNSACPRVPEPSCAPRRSSSILRSSCERGAPPKTSQKPARSEPGPRPGSHGARSAALLSTGSSDSSAGSHPAHRDTEDVVTCSLAICGEGTAGADPAICCLIPACSSSPPPLLSCLPQFPPSLGQFESAGAMVRRVLLEHRGGTGEPFVQNP